MNRILFFLTLWPVLCAVSQCDDDDWTKALITGGGELSCKFGSSYCERNANARCNVSDAVYEEYGYYDFYIAVPLIIYDGIGSYKSYISFSLAGEGNLAAGRKYYIDRWDRSPGRKDYPVRYAGIDGFHGQSGWIFFREIEIRRGELKIKGEFEFTVADGDKLLQVKDGKFDLSGYVDKCLSEPSWW